MPALSELVDLAARPGRRTVAPLTATYVRDLTAEDLIAAGSTTMGYKNAELQTIRNSHHTIARLLAKGTMETEVSIIVGITPSRISVLKGSPAFAELLSYYEDMEEQGYNAARADMHERLAQFGFDSIETLHQRLLDNPDLFSAKELMAAVELVSDRTGYGKTSTVNSNVSHSVSPETLARLRANVSDRAVLAPEDRATLLGLAVRATEVDPDAEAPDWIEGEGRVIREEGDPSSPIGVGDCPSLSPVD